MSKATSRAALKWRLFLLRALSLACCVGPLAVVFFVNFDTYVKTAQDAVKLTVGGVIILVLIVLRVLGKLKMPRRIVVYAVVAALAWLMEPVLSDIVVLCVVGLSGETVDYIIFSPMVKRTEEALLIDRAADETSARVAAQVEDIMKSYTGRV
jgi:hypothetical protein